MYTLSPHTKKFYFERNSVWINLSAGGMTKPKGTQTPTLAVLNRMPLINFTSDAAISK